MSFLIFSARRQDIIARKSALEYKLLELNKKLIDLQTYAASIGDGGVSVNDLMQAPPSVFGKMLAFAQGSALSATQYAQQNAGVVMAMNQANLQAMMAQMPDQNRAAYAQQYQRMIEQQLRAQGIKSAAEREQKMLALEDRKIEQEKVKLEGLIKTLSAEEETVKKAEDEGAKNSAPKYTA